MSGRIIWLYFKAGIRPDTGIGNERWISDQSWGGEGLPAPRGGLHHSPEDRIFVLLNKLMMVVSISHLFSI